MPYADTARVVATAPLTMVDDVVTEHAAISVHTLRGAASSWYVPQSLPPGVRDQAVRLWDARLLKLKDVVDSPDNPVELLQMVTNDNDVASTLTERMLGLGVRGYLSVEPATAREARNGDYLLAVNSSESGDLFSTTAVLTALQRRWPDLVVHFEDATWGSPALCRVNLPTSAVAYSEIVLLADGDGIGIEIDDPSLAAEVVVLVRQTQQLPHDGGPTLVHWASDTLEITAGVTVAKLLAV